MFDNLMQLLIKSFNRFHQIKKINTSNDASYVVNLARAFVAYSMELIGGTDVALDRLDINNATGSDLDALGDNYDLERSYGTPAIGYVFLWELAPTRTRVIPNGTVISTADGTSFITTVDSIIPHDKSLYPQTDVYHPDYVSNTFHRYYALPLKEGVVYDDTRLLKDQVEWTRNIAIRAIGIGKGTNVDAQEIMEVGISIGGTNSSGTEESGVINELPLSGGSDEETDDEFRDRVKKHMAGTSTTTKKALEAAALFTGIDDARVLEAEDENAGITPPFGAIYVVVASARAKYTPQWAAAEPEVGYPVSYATTLKEEIRNALNDLVSVGVRPIVREADVVSINFSDQDNTDEPMTIFVAPGTNLLIYTGIIDTALREYLESRKIGEDIYKSEIMEVLKDVSPVVDIGPFELVANRWRDFGDGSGESITSYGSTEGELEGRDGIIIQTQEIARPDRLAMNFKLEHDAQVR